MIFLWVLWGAPGRRPGLQREVRGSRGSEPLLQREVLLPVVRNSRASRYSRCKKIFLREIALSYFPSIGKVNGRFFQALEKLAGGSSKPWKTAGWGACVRCAREGASGFFRAENIFFGGFAASACIRLGVVAQSRHFFWRGRNGVVAARGKRALAEFPRGAQAVRSLSKP